MSGTWGHTYVIRSGGGCRIRRLNSSVCRYIDSGAVGGSLKSRLSVWWQHSGASYKYRAVGVDGASAGTNVRAVVIVVMAVEPEPLVVSKSGWRVPCTASVDTSIVRACKDFNVMNAP